jgi:chromosome partitioning protein
MKSNKVCSLLNISKPKLLREVEKHQINPQKTGSGENIFRWKHITKLRYNFDFDGKEYSSKVISINQNKGGVGKTTSSINIATMFSYLGKTLVIDLDSQGNLSQAFNIYTADSDLSLVDALDSPELAQRTIYTAGENLDIIPNNLKFDRWKKTALKENRIVSFDLQKVLSQVKDNYQFIVIDTPPALDLSLEIALYAADYCIIPFEPDSFSMEGIENIFEEIKTIKKEDKTGFFNVKTLGLFITRYEKNSLSEQIIDYINNKYDVFETKIRKAIAVKQSQAEKVSIFDYEESSTAAHDYYNLSFEILQGILK